MDLSTYCIQTTDYRHHRNQAGKGRQEVECQTNRNNRQMYVWSWSPRNHELVHIEDFTIPGSGSRQSETQLTRLIARDCLRSLFSRREAHLPCNHLYCIDVHDSLTRIPNLLQSSQLSCVCVASCVPRHNLPSSLSFQTITMMWMMIMRVLAGMMMRRTVNELFPECGRRHEIRL